MRLMLVLMVLAGGIARAQAREVRQWQYSAAFLSAASVADSVSSWHQPEVNPILGSRFEVKSVLIKSVIVGGALGVEWILVRRHPETRRAFTVTNWIAGAGTLGIAGRNWRMR